MGEKHPILSLLCLLTDFINTWSLQSIIMVDIVSITLPLISSKLIKNLIILYWFFWQVPQRVKCWKNKLILTTSSSLDSVSDSLSLSFLTCVATQSVITWYVEEFRERKTIDDTMWVRMSLKKKRRTVEVVIFEVVNVRG